MANNSTSSLGSGSTTISGGVLAGSGKTGNGMVTVGSGGTITAGTGATTSDTTGTLNTGPQVWTTGGKYVVKIGAGTNDELVMSGLSMAGSGSFNIQLTGLSNTTLTNGEQLKIADAGTGNTPFANTAFLNALNFIATNLPAGVSTGNFSVDTNSMDTNGGEDLILEYTGSDVSAAPEPGSALLLGLAASPLMLSRRRRVADLDR